MARGAAAVVGYRERVTSFLQRCKDTVLLIPLNLQAVFWTHLLSGVLLFSGVFNKDGDQGYGALFLGMSCVVVLALCHCPPGLGTEPSKKKLEADLEASAACAITTESGKVTTQSETLAIEAAAKTEDVADPDAISIPSQATMLDALRILLACNLRGARVTALSESQAELLEHHLLRLASYCDKIVQTIAFAQRVLTEVDATKEEQLGEAVCLDDAIREEEAAQEEAQRQAAEESAAKKKHRTLRLADEELLAIYQRAQQEAQAEADWRGIGIIPAVGGSTAAAAVAKNREAQSWLHETDRVPPLHLPAASGGVDAAKEPSGACGARRAASGSSGVCYNPATPADSSRGGDSSNRTERKRERHEAIGLLGEALAVRVAANKKDLGKDLTAASEDLTWRLIPTRPNRSPCVCFAAALAPEDHFMHTWRQPMPPFAGPDEVVVGDNFGFSDRESGAGVGPLDKS